LISPKPWKPEYQIRKNSQQKKLPKELSADFRGHPEKTLERPVE
jgi:hypothetical protein